LVGPDLFSYHVLALHTSPLGQRGLFATKKLSKGQLICHYFGEVHSDDRPSSNYDLCLHRFPNGESIGIDASNVGNEVGAHISQQRPELTYL
jgi:hypothetical protein